MVERFRIYYRHELRPAGDYLSSDTAQEMGGERETQPESIAVLLKTALAYNREGESAQRLLVQYYLLQGDDNRADSLLKILERSSPPNAAVLNDCGIWYCQQAQYDSAAIIFKRAFALDPSLDEALYNLAITYTRRGNLAAAKETWQHYLTLNVPAEWRNAALTQLQELEEGLMR
jgi:Tfp pilus assembly protein PilF